MQIEYIYHHSAEEKAVAAEIKRLNRENTLGCLFSGLFLLCFLYIALLLLPYFLVIIGCSIIFLAVYIGYKMYLESFVLNFIQKHNLRR